MERVTILTIREAERLVLRRDTERTFRVTGDAMLYHMIPCIVLGSGSDLRRRITLPESFILLKDSSSNAWGSYINIRNMEDVYRIQDELGLERMETGLHISSDPSNLTFLTDIESVGAFSLAQAEIDAHTFRIIQQKRL